MPAAKNATSLTDRQKLGVSCGVSRCFAVISCRGDDFTVLDDYRTHNGIYTYPYRLVIPAVVISLIVLSLNLFGDGLRDAFDPKLNR